MIIIIQRVCGVGAEYAQCFEIKYCTANKIILLMYNKFRRPVRKIKKKCKQIICSNLYIYIYLIIRVYDHSVHILYTAESRR